MCQTIGKLNMPSSPNSSVKNPKKLILIADNTMTQRGKKNEIKMMDTVQDKITKSNINIETPRSLNNVLGIDEISMSTMEKQFNTLNLPWDIVGGVL